MAKIRKFIKGIYQYANLFKISNPTESVGDNEVKQIVPYRGVIQNQGDFITAEDHNEIQKNGVLFVKAEYSENFGTGVDAYVIKNYYNEQNLFDGLKLKFQIPKTNLYAAPVLIIEGLQYNLKIINNNIVENARKGELNKNEIISVIYFDGNFILENSRAGEESYGITRYGITTDTALEGKRLAEIIGLEFGGNIQDTGMKSVGKFYFDTVNKYYYECIVNNNLTYNDVTKFRAISNKPISDKLENLFKVETKRINITNGFVKFTKTGNIVSCFLHLANATQPFTFNNDTQLINYPAEFIPNSEYFHTEHVMMAQERNNINGTVRLIPRESGIKIWGAQGKQYYEIKGTFTYCV